MKQLVEAEILSSGMIVPKHEVEVVCKARSF
jgi:hypothetical protein